MKFLCLHGAIGNTENLSIQLGPIQKDLEIDNAASFHYINGPCQIDSPPGFEDYFGIGPHYRWVDDGGEAKDSMLSRIRELPLGHDPEDVMRSLAKGAKSTEWRNHQQVLDLLYGTLENDPEIEGIIGYSEGASMAATFLLDEQWREQQTGRPRRIKCAMFLTGWPPLSPDEKMVLADESDLYIDVPTLHVVGANDPYRYGALALYNVSDEDSAELFDTGKGHTIPRAGDVIVELGNAIRSLISRARFAEA